MNVLFTGISGVNKLEYIKRIVDLLKKEGQKIELFDVWTEMKKASEDMRKPVNKKTILNAGNLDELRAIVFERINHNIETDPEKGEKDYFIVTHACFRWNKFLRKGMDPHYLNNLKPDMYITINDNITDIHSTLKEDDQWEARQFEYEELITWQNEEIFLTRFMADYDNRPFYLIAKREPVESIYRIFLKSGNIKKAYISYPITAIKKENPEILSQVNIAANELRKKIIAFNPLSITDLDFEPGIFGSEAVKHLRESTVERDYMLIDQSDMIIVFYPVQSNSPGVNSEILYGYSHNKEVYLYYPYPKSPFWDEGIAITKHFKSLDEFNDHFKINLKFNGGKTNE